MSTIKFPANFPIKDLQNVELNADTPSAKIQEIQSKITKAKHEKVFKEAAADWNLEEIYEHLSLLKSAVKADKTKILDQLSGSVKELQSFHLKVA